MKKEKLAEAVEPLIDLTVAAFLLAVMLVAVVVAGVAVVLPVTAVRILACLTK